MKYLLLILLLAGFFFVLGLKRSRPRDGTAKPHSPPPVPPQAMQRCSECGLHLPAGDALPGQGGVFCSAAHRSAFEARQGPA